MRLSHFTFRLALITLAVLAGHWVGGSSASACAMKMTDGSSCIPASRCGCCKPASARPTQSAAQPSVVVAVIAEPVLAGATKFCEIPSTCGCGTDRPAPPDHRPGRVAEVNRVPIARECPESCESALPPLVQLGRSIDLGVVLSVEAALYLRYSRLLF